MTEEETIRTRVLQVARTNWKQVIAYAITGVSTMVAISVSVGRSQGDAATLAARLDAVGTELHEVHGQVNDMAKDQASLKSTVNGFHEDMQDFKGWKDRVSDVAETFKVPHEKHRK